MTHSPDPWLSTELLALCAQVNLVGSRATCSPAPTDTDIDYLVFVSREKYDALMEVLSGEGWALGGSLGLAQARGSAFLSFRLGELNLIVTDHEDFHKRFLVGTALAKRLNVFDKEDRKALFQAVLYGNEHNVHSLEIPLYDPI